MRGFIRGGGGGVLGFIQGECAWFYLGGHVWFYLGGAYMVLFRGCVVLFGGMHGFIRGRAWFYSGGMRGFFSFFGYNEIRSMSGRYASYWNAFLYLSIFA